MLGVMSQLFMYPSYTMNVLMLWCFLFVQVLKVSFWQLAVDLGCRQTILICEDKLTKTAIRLVLAGYRLLFLKPRLIGANEQEAVQLEASAVALLFSTGRI